MTTSFAADNVSRIFKKRKEDAEMDRRQIGTALTLKELGLFPPELEHFDGRLIIQKAIYLAQAAGIDLGYYFRWYLRGPYSPEVARDVFAIDDEVAGGFDESDGWILGERARAKLCHVAGLIPEGDRGQRAPQLELFASLHFLVTRHQVSGCNPAELREALQECGKDFSLSDIEEALAELQAHGLLPR